MSENPHELTLALITLGCPKNLVDSEHMSGILQQDGFALVTDPAEARVIVVNTCGFIESAKQEAIATILDMADYKHDLCDFLVVTGCLSQRYGKDILQEMPEVDAVLGTSQYAQIAKIIRRLYDHASNSQGGAQRLNWTDFDPDHTLDQLSSDRILSTGSFAYLKIAEGCSNLCTYCAIPGIRGPQVSRPFAEIMQEAERLEQMGIEEIVLIAQDTTAYGLDLYGERRLTELLLALDQLNFSQIRFLYAYSDGISDELLAAMAGGRHLVHYLDLPIQHASDSVLRRMGRRDTQDRLRERFTKAREFMPDLSLRTTVMVGFPGETDAEFEELLSFVSEMAFDHLGCFVFSPEEGTAAVRLPGPVPAEVAAARHERVMALQQAIRQKRDQRRVGETWPVLIDGICDDGIFYLGRASWQAPEIDSRIYILATDEELQIGQQVKCRIVEASDYDYTGVTVYESA